MQEPCQPSGTGDPADSRGQCAETGQILPPAGQIMPEEFAWSAIATASGGPFENDAQRCKAEPVDGEGSNLRLPLKRIFAAPEVARAQRPPRFD
jgi:hypothetical protein